ncbi:SpoIID/LytB domain-containing protein [Synechococcus sp. RSCCF101]|uniref:SpoIID/LytB domain-containing protein n=1 Tax=Synechococcus sp. RSCCF101 TaxID=2511069 RepID=UPI001248CAA0|nr:SpoIID/LytB domain-containing protein [Synechococcus sp. RSCCF101]QEY32539.1 SpoIID/LytB domain-containing protein [Synechococcus sp. RSCCF101]
MVALGLTAACDRTSAQVLTRRPVPPPPPVDAVSPVLWVALEDQLGRSGPLVLSAAEGPVTLTDAEGQRWSAPSVRLSWRAVPLDEPLTVRRAVLGPYPSFESAEQVARRWRELSVDAEVAHPSDWEVWAPADSPAPAGLTPSLHGSVITSRLQPVLEGMNAADGGEVLPTGPLRIEAPGGLRWDGGVFRGPFRLQPDAHGTWTLVEQVPLERYLLGVVPHEIGASAPAASQSAQAILARTWALSNSHRFHLDGYHLCSDTQCQVYEDPRQASPRVTRAVQATAGQVLTWRGTPIHAVYHASNGGVRAGYDEAWSGQAPPYLQPAADGDASFRERVRLPLSSEDEVRSVLEQPAGIHGQRHPRFRWTRSLQADAVGSALAAAGRPVGRPERIQVVERGPSGRATALVIDGSDGRTQLRLDAIRRTLRSLPSTLFVVDRVGDGRWQLSGGGFGHGVGLSQAGAMDLARRGWTPEAILMHYYPGTQLRSLAQMEAPEPVQGP